MNTLTFGLFVRLVYRGTGHLPVRVMVMCVLCPFRHLLLAHQTLQNVPPIVFIQDKKSAVLAQVRLMKQVLERP